MKVTGMLNAFCARALACFFIGSIMVTQPGCGPEVALLPLVASGVSIVAGAAFTENQIQQSRSTMLDIEKKRQELQRR